MPHFVVCFFSVSWFLKLENLILALEENKLIIYEKRIKEVETQHHENKDEKCATLRCITDCDDKLNGGTMGLVRLGTLCSTRLLDKNFLISLCAKIR